MRKREFNQFEKMLFERRAQILKNIHDAHDELDQLNHAELNDEGDFASASSESMIDQVITTQQSKELGEIEYALAKIKDGSYGTCEMCEEQIGKDRLKVKPHAKYCIVCREIVEKSGTSN